MISIPKLVIAGYNEQGPRDYNEDRYLVLHLDMAGSEHLLMAVADGLGGEGFGHLAAEACLKQLVKDHLDLATAFAEYCRYSPPVLSDEDDPIQDNPLEKLQKKVNEVIRKINATLSKKQRQLMSEMETDETDGLGMLSTLTVLMLFENHGLLFWLGDSRAYCFQNGWLHQISKDHERKGYVSKYIGPAAHMIPDFKEIDILPGDVYFLCSDGLSGYCLQDELEGMVRYTLAHSQEPAELCKELVGYVRDNTRDNITVTALVYHPLNWPPALDRTYTKSEINLPHITKVWTDFCFSKDGTFKTDAPVDLDLEGGLSKDFFFPGQRVCTRCGAPQKGLIDSICQNHDCKNKQFISGPFVEVTDGDRLLYKPIAIDIPQILEGGADFFMMLGDLRLTHTQPQNKRYIIDLSELPSFAGEALSIVIKNNAAPRIESFVFEYSAKLVVPSRARWRVLNDHCFTTKGFFRGSVLRFKDAIIRFLCTTPVPEIEKR